MQILFTNQLHIWCRHLKSSAHGMIIRVSYNNTNKVIAVETSNNEVATKTSRQNAFSIFKLQCYGTLSTFHVPKKSFNVDNMFCVTSKLQFSRKLYIIYLINQCRRLTSVVTLKITCCKNMFCKTLSKRVYQNQLLIKRV